MLFKRSLAWSVGSASFTALCVTGVMAVTEYDANFNDGEYDPTIIVNWWSVAFTATIVAALVGITVFCIAWLYLSYAAQRPKRVPMPQAETQ